MPILSSGSNITLTVAAGQILTVQSDAATFDFENPVGTRVGEYACDSVFGPFASAGSVKITSVQGPVYYELANRPVGSSVPFDPSSVAITGGTIGGRSVADITAAARPSLTTATLPLYIAHRGCAGLYPEETAVAYNRALADGELFLEGDIQTLSDGSLGMMHDSTVDRTTAGTGNVSAFTSSTFQALGVDASTWLGTNYGDTIPPIMFQAYIDAYKTRGILCPEDKDLASMTALVRALVNSGVGFDQALVQSFATAGLTTAINAGYQACGLSSAGSPTAAAIAATGAKWAAIASTDALSSFVAAGLKTLVYTINRRYQRDQFLSQGASGFYSDDPTYLRNNTALATTDSFSKQTWIPGMLANTTDTGIDLPYRGQFTAPNYWGYTSASTPASYCGCLHGYLCPVANPQSFTFSFNLIYDSANAGDTTKWVHVFLGTSDRPYTNNSDTTSGYSFLMRLNGTIAIYKKDSGLVDALQQQTVGSALNTGTEYTIKIAVTPSTLTLSIFNGATLVSTVTATESTYRGGYIQLGRNSIACRFRAMSVA